jgi:hypothetical protein
MQLLLHTAPELAGLSYSFYEAHSKNNEHIGMDVEGNDPSLFPSTILAPASRKWGKPENSQSKYPVP